MNDFKSILVFGKNYSKTTQQAMFIANEIVRMAYSSNKNIKVEFILKPTDEIEQLQNEIFRLKEKLGINNFIIDEMEEK